MSHTPGPWKCERLIDNTGKPYATLYECHIDLGPCMIWAPPGNLEQEANANLIAAAPELLEALEQCLRHIEQDEATHGRSFAAGNVARAAIKKARGEA